MMNSIFAFARTVNRFEISGTAALIVGLAGIISPELISALIITGLVLTIWLALSINAFFKVLISLAVIFLGGWALGGINIFIAAALTLFGSAAVISLAYRFISNEIKRNSQEQQETEEEETLSDM